MACFPSEEQCVCIERQCLNSGKGETVVESFNGEAYSTWDSNVDSPNPFDFGLSPRQTLRGLTTPRAQLHLEQSAIKRQDKIAATNGTVSGEDDGFHEIEVKKESSCQELPVVGEEGVSFLEAVEKRTSCQKLLGSKNAKIQLCVPVQEFESLIQSTESSTRKGSGNDIASATSADLDPPREQENSPRTSTQSNTTLKRRRSGVSKLNGSSFEVAGSLQTYGRVYTEALTIRTEDSNGDVVGLDLLPFTLGFDQHFNVDSQKIHYILDPIYKGKVDKAVADKSPTWKSVHESQSDLKAYSSGYQSEDDDVADTMSLDEGSTGVAKYSSPVAKYSSAHCRNSIQESESLEKGRALTDEISQARSGKKSGHNSLVFLRSSTARNKEMQTLEDARWLFESFKKDPGYWGISVTLIWSLWKYVEEDLMNYANSHYVDTNFEHICLVPHCRWHHDTMGSSLRASAITEEIQAGSGKCKMMEPNMHLVVNRYVKPWTGDFEDAGLALVFNAGSVSDHKQVPLAQSCRPSVFISHCWNERFDLFARTLKESLDPGTIVWVCSFAIWQHGEIQKQLGDLEDCPFAHALQASQRVLLVTDLTTEAVTRSWCVLEAELARKWNKYYDMCLHDDYDADLWSIVGSKIEAIDLEQCEATVASDKEAILDYARRNYQNGIEGLNQQVQAIAKTAKERARLMAAAANGDVSTLLRTNLKDLQSLRSVRGRSLVHIAASCGRVAVIAMLAGQLGLDSLRSLDDEGNSPLCVAAADGALSSVQALLSQKANVNEHYTNMETSGTLKPLHFAAAHGHATITLVLVHAGADVECEAKFQGVYGRRPLHVAARLGHKEVIGMLVRHSADFNACAKNGMTAIFHAVSGRHTDALAALLALEADANQVNRDVYKKTPLMGAVGRNSPAMVSILLEAQADPRLKDGKGHSCLQYMSTLSTHETSQIKTLIQGAMKGKRSKPCICAAM